MAASFTYPENTINYKLFPVINAALDKSKSISSVFEILAEDYISKISGFLNRYIWQNDAFNLCLVENTNSVHLEGATCFEDNIEDEWFIVYLLFYLSERDKNLIIQVQDGDGEFLLIEAAEYLPKWLNPDSSENRVFIYQGCLHIIPIAQSPDHITPLATGTPSLSDAVSVVRKFSSVTKASKEIQEAVKNKINGYPHKIDENKHRAHCYVPCAIAAILQEDPHLLPHAVKAFYSRDPIDLKACKAMKYFAPETRVMTEVVFTKFLYAQLSSQKYEPDKMTGWNLPPPHSPEMKTHSLGMKLACGFEILAANVEKIMHVENDEEVQDFDNDIRWKRFAKSLSDKGYFKGEIEGTKLYNRLLLQAKEFYLSSLKKDVKGNLNPGTRVRKHLETLSFNYEEMKESEKNLKAADDDSWINITPAVLETMLEKMSHQQPSAGDVGEKITKGIKSFVNHMSGLEGAELPPTKSNKKQKISFDPDAFTDAINKILDFRIPESDDDSSSSMSGYSDDNDEDVDLNEGNQDEYNDGCSNEKVVSDEMKDYMNDMDRELAKTTIGLSFERLPPSDVAEEVPVQDVNEEDDDFQPVNIDMTALKNILESYSSQHGLPGPASNLFSSMGIQLPDDVET